MMDEDGGKKKKKRTILRAWGGSYLSRGKKKCRLERKGGGRHLPQQRTPAYPGGKKGKALRKGSTLPKKKGKKSLRGKGGKKKNPVLRSSQRILA